MSTYLETLKQKNSEEIQTFSWLSTEVDLLTEMYNTLNYTNKEKQNLELAVEVKLETLKKLEASIFADSQIIYVLESSIADVLH